jgi:hypothetical protein
MDEYERLMKAEILRDELIAECTTLINELDDQKLSSVRTVIKSLGGWK